MPRANLTEQYQKIIFRKTLIKLFNIYLNELVFIKVIKVIEEIIIEGKSRKALVWGGHAQRKHSIRKLSNWEREIYFKLWQEDTYQIIACSYNVRLVLSGLLSSFCCFLIPNKNYNIWNHSNDQAIICLLLGESHLNIN